MFAKEGYPFIIASLAILVIMLIVPKSILLILAALLFIMMLWFFRDPERISPHDPTAVVSAADGKVVEISEVELYGDKYKKVSVFMNLFSVHVNRMPYAGTIDEVRHIPGGFANADTPQASMHNERNEIHILTTQGRIIAVQVAGLVARRTVSYVKQGDKLSKGERMGIIKFSSRVDHYLPVDATLETYLGAKVTAGESIIARLKPL